MTASGVGRGRLGAPKDDQRQREFHGGRPLGASSESRVSGPPQWGQIGGPAAQWFLPPHSLVCRWRQRGVVWLSAAVADELLLRAAYLLTTTTTTTIYYYDERPATHHTTPPPPPRPSTPPPTHAPTTTDYALLPQQHQTVTLPIRWPRLEASSCR